MKVFLACAVLSHLARTDAYNIEAELSGADYVCDESPCVSYVFFFAKKGLYGTFTYVCTRGPFMNCG